MRRLLLALLLVVVLATPFQADSRPVNCDAALEECYRNCQSTFGELLFLTQSCMAGCNLGYLFC